MIAYCLRMSFGVPQKLVIVSLNNKSYSYPSDKASLGKFRNQQQHLREGYTLPAFTRVEVSKSECELLVEAATRHQIPIVNVKLISALYLELGYNSRQHRYWDERDGHLCGECLLPFKVHVHLPESNLFKDKPHVCGHCVLKQLEKRGFASYTLEKENES